MIPAGRVESKPLPPHQPAPAGSNTSNQTRLSTDGELSATQLRSDNALVHAGPMSAPDNVAKPSRKRTANSVGGSQQEPRKRPAQGPNKRVLEYADRVLQDVGANSTRLERDIRLAFGNNPDTSKALRMLASDRKVIRFGRGGRGDPFHYQITDYGRECLKAGTGDTDDEQKSCDESAAAAGLSGNGGTAPVDVASNSDDIAPRTPRHSTIVSGLDSPVVLVKDEQGCQLACHPHESAAASPHCTPRKPEQSSAGDHTNTAASPFLRRVLECWQPPASRVVVRTPVHKYKHRAITSAGDTGCAPVRLHLRKPQKTGLLQTATREAAAEGSSPTGRIAASSGRAVPTCTETSPRCHPELSHHAAVSLVQATTAVENTPRACPATTQQYARPDAFTGEGRPQARPTPARGSSAGPQRSLFSPPVSAAIEPVKSVPVAAAPPPPLTRELASQPQPVQPRAQASDSAQQTPRQTATQEHQNLHSTGTLPGTTNAQQALGNAAIHPRVQAPCTPAVQVSATATGPPRPPSDTTAMGTSAAKLAQVHAGALPSLTSLLAAAANVAGSLQATAAPPRTTATTLGSGRTDGTPANKVQACAREILKLIGKRGVTFERDVRKLYGNNPDTSKALRMLTCEGKLQRCGSGGRSDPYRYQLTLSGTSTVLSCTPGDGAPAAQQPIKVALFKPPTAQQSVGATAARTPALKNSSPALRDVTGLFGNRQQPEVSSQSCFAGGKPRVPSLLSAAAGSITADCAHGLPPGSRRAVLPPFAALNTLRATGCANTCNEVPATPTSGRKRPDVLSEGARGYSGRSHGSLSASGWTLTGATSGCPASVASLTATQGTSQLVYDDVKSSLARAQSLIGELDPSRLSAGAALLSALPWYEQQQYDATRSYGTLAWRKELSLPLQAAADGAVGPKR